MLVGFFSKIFLLVVVSSSGSLVETNYRHSSWLDQVRSGLSVVLEISCFQHLVYVHSLTFAPTSRNLQKSSTLDEASKCICTCIC